MKLGDSAGGLPTSSNASDYAEYRVERLVRDLFLPGPPQARKPRALTRLELRKSRAARQVSVSAWIFGQVRSLCPSPELWWRPSLRRSLRVRIAWQVIHKDRRSEGRHHNSGD